MASHVDCAIALGSLLIPSKKSSQPYGVSEFSARLSFYSRQYLPYC